MRVLKPFRGRVLESILIIAAVAVAVAAVTVVANLLTLTARFSEMTGNTLYARQLVLKPKADDYEAFYQGVVSVDAREVGPKESETPELAFTDLAAVKAAAPSVTYAYIEDSWSFDHQALENSGSLWVSKVTAEFQEAAGLNVSEGSLMSASDFSERNRVMLISPAAIKKLKLKAPFVGQKVAFENEGSYTIVGVLKLTDAQDDDDYYESFIPWTPSEWDGIRQLTFSVAKAADVPQAQSEIRAYADKTWGETVSVRSNAEGNRVYLEQQRTSNLIVAIFAQTLNLETDDFNPDTLFALPTPYRTVGTFTSTITS